MGNDSSFEQKSPFREIGPGIFNMKHDASWSCVTSNESLIDEGVSVDSLSDGRSMVDQVTVDQAFSPDFS